MKTVMSVLLLGGLGRKNKYVSQGGSVSTSGMPIKELF